MKYIVAALLFTVMCLAYSNYAMRMEIYNLQEYVQSIDPFGPIGCTNDCWEEKNDLNV